MGNASVHEIVGILASIVTLAGLTVIVLNGGKASKVITAAGDSFVKSIKAATQQGK